MDHQDVTLPDLIEVVAHLQQTVTDLQKQLEDHQFRIRKLENPNAFHITPEYERQQAEQRRRDAEMARQREEDRRQARLAEEERKRPRYLK